MSASAKSLRVERIKSEAAKAYLDRHHPLGSGGGFSIALGVFWDGRLSGVMTIGGPISNSAGTALGLRQFELAELRKMHFQDVLPQNSESRALAILVRLIRKHQPKIKAIITYCDNEEGATAYKGAGWIPMAAHRYLRDLKIDGKWYTIRDANRHGITKRATEKRFECRRKWAMPLDEEVRLRIARAVPSPGTAGAESPPRESKRSVPEGTRSTPPSGHRPLCTDSR